VPRYFIGRAILESASLQDAIQTATMPGRAFPWHHNLASLPDGKIVSLETWPGRHHLKEIEGLYVHTNHLLHPEMTGFPEEMKYVSSSSMTRYRVITDAVRRKEPENADEMVRLLSSHEGRPYSPCRHPEGEIHGATLGTAVFESPELAMTLYCGNPCRGQSRTYRLCEGGDADLP
jgi:hypothetical protein